MTTFKVKREFTEGGPDDPLCRPANAQQTPARIVIKDPKTGLYFKGYLLDSGTSWTASKQDALVYTQAEWLRLRSGRRGLALTRRTVVEEACS